MGGALSLGGGGDFSMKCLDVCVEGKKNVPIMNDALDHETYLILKGS